MKGRAPMEKADQEMMYWHTVHDSAELFVHNNIDPRTFLGDVLDCVLRVRPESRQAFQILGILDYFTQLKDYDDANDIASEVFKA
jgi:hypothetical protein